MASPPVPTYPHSGPGMDLPPNRSKNLHPHARALSSKKYQEPAADASLSCPFAACVVGCVVNLFFFDGLGRIDVLYTHRPPRLAMPVRPLVCCLRVPTLDPLHDIGRPKRLQDASCQSSTSPSKPAPAAAYDLCPMLFVVLFPLASIERPRNLGCWH